MHKIALSFAILGLSAGAAFAQMDMSFADVDTDASGEVSLAELQVHWPDFTPEEFAAADSDTSSGLGADEFDALQAGMTPDAATMAPAAPAPAMAPAPAAPMAAPTGTEAPVATDIDAGSTSSSETENSGGDAGAGN